jgi:hypothetical protein
MANSYTDAETVSALDRERQFRARSGDFAIWSFQPVRQALGEWPVFALTGPLESTSSYVRDKREPRLSSFFLPDNRMNP